MATVPLSERPETFRVVVQLPVLQTGLAVTPPTFTETVLVYSEQVPLTVYADLFVLLMAGDDVIATLGRPVFLITVVEAWGALLPAASL